MIVTCPNCVAKYRVRDEVVPEDGAQLKCPECSTVFVAHRPQHSDDELREALARATRAKDALDQELEQTRGELARTRGELARTQGELARTQGELDQVRQGADDEAKRFAQEREQLIANQNKLRPEVNRLEIEVMRLSEQLSHGRAEYARLQGEVTSLQTQADVSLVQSAKIRELEQALAQKAEEPSNGMSLEYATCRAELAKAQKTVGRLTTELESAQSVIGRQQLALRDLQAAHEGSEGSPHPAEGSPAVDDVVRLKDELTQLRARLEASAQVTGMVASASPLLWGLDQAVENIGGLVGEHPSLAPHLRQLQLLAGFLRRLQGEDAERPSAK